MDPHLGELVSELLRQQVVEETVRSGWAYRLFTAPKPTEKRKTILDISLLNPNIKKNSFNFPSIHTLRKILNLCEEKEIHLKIFRIPSKLNVIADALSRKDPLPSEWTLDPKGRGPLLLGQGCLR